MNEKTNKAIEPIDAGATPAILLRLLALNNAHAQELSWLEGDKLDALIRSAFLARRIGGVEAFILAFDQDSDYRSENFLWFKARYARFVYVDRIVVAADARGRGLARRLYEGVFAAAVQCGQNLVVCEVNAEPPNAESDAFHKAFGFETVGFASLGAGEKRVRYLCLDLNEKFHGGKA